MTKRIFTLWLGTRFWKARAVKGYVRSRPDYSFARSVCCREFSLSSCMSVRSASLCPGSWTQHRIVDTAGQGHSVGSWTQMAVDTACCRGHSRSRAQHRVVDTNGREHSKSWTQRAVETAGHGHSIGLWTHRAVDTSCPGHS